MTKKQNAAQTTNTVSAKPIKLAINLKGLHLQKKGKKDRLMWVPDEKDPEVGHDEKVTLECNCDCTVNGTVELVLEGYTECINTPAGMKFMEALAATIGHRF